MTFAELMEAGSAFANQNAAINVLPFEGVYAFAASISHHFLNDRW